MARSVLIRRATITAFVIIVAALLVTLSPAPSRAERKAGPCADDAAKFCKDVEAGGGHKAKCLHEHEQELAPGCKAMMEKKKGAK